jgi:predicted TIM-barrel fold metal-dependent hydrolase
MTSKKWSGFVNEEAINPDLPIVDTHHHIWNESPRAIFDPYTTQELIQDKVGSGHNVVATVMVDSHAQHSLEGPEAFRPVGETVYCEKVAQEAEKAGGRIAGVCAAIVPYADLRLGAAVGEVLDAHADASPRFRGIRYMLAMVPELPPIYGATEEGISRTPEFRAGFAELARRGLSFEHWVFQPQHDEVLDLARAFPDTPIVLNHLGGPMGHGRYKGKREEGFQDWKRSMTALASCPNIVVKLGGTYVCQTSPEDIGWPARPASSEEMAEINGDYILTAIDLFSPSRCMFESNFPVDMLYTSYGNLWNSFKRVVSGFSHDEQLALFSETAKRVYKLKL